MWLVENAAGDLDGRLWRGVQCYFKTGTFFRAIGQRGEGQLCMLRRKRAGVCRLPCLPRCLIVPWLIDIVSWRRDVVGSPDMNVGIIRCVLPVLLTLFGTTHLSFAAQPLCGGYSEASVTNAEVIAAAKFAVEYFDASRDSDRPVSLVEILKAEQQVVAGMNYRLRLKVRLNGEERGLEAVVWWQAWNKTEPYRLTSWTWKNEEAPDAKSATNHPAIPEQYKGYHFLSDTNLPPDIIKAMQVIDTALQVRNWKGDSQGVVYRITKMGKGYNFSCLPYWVRDGRMGFVGGSSYFGVLDEDFKVVEIQPGT